MTAEADQRLPTKGSIPLILSSRESTVNDLRPDEMFSKAGADTWMTFHSQERNGGRVGNADDTLPLVDDFANRLKNVAHR